MYLSSCQAIVSKICLVDLIFASFKEKCVTYSRHKIMYHLILICILTLHHQLTQKVCQNTRKVVETSACAN